MIGAVFAVDDTGGMGKGGTIPWPFNKQDMMWFKGITQNQVVVMGRKSWDSPDMIKPLPNRQNIVFTNNFFEQDGIEQVRGDVCEALLAIAERYPTKDILVIGGADLLVKAKPVIQVAYVTRIAGNFECDTRIDIDEFLKGFKLEASYDLGTCVVEKYATI